VAKNVKIEQNLAAAYFFVEIWKVLQNSSKPEKHPREKFCSPHMKFLHLFTFLKVNFACMLPDKDRNIKKIINFFVDFHSFFMWLIENCLNKL
jgi:hypothetical protein